MTPGTIEIAQPTTSFETGYSTANSYGPPNTRSVVPTEQKSRPRLGCAGLVWRGDTLLLGRRNKEPNRGMWVLPGGGVEFGESFAQTLRRELSEEAGIDVAVRGVFQTYELINAPKEHRVIVYLLADHVSGEPVASSDLAEVRFLSALELRDLDDQGLISPFVKTVLRDAKLL